MTSSPDRPERHCLRTERQWRVLNAVLGVLLAASIIPMWLGSERARHPTDGQLWFV